MLDDFHDGLSIDRLSVYGRDGAPPELVVARYLWNVAVSESLYPALQMCEVGFRNSMHRALTVFCGSERWYDALDLTAWAERQVGKAKSDLKRRRRPTEPGRVIAELNFALWTSLLEPHYEQSVKFMPTNIKRVFPAIPKSMQKRTELKRRADRIRRLRNRVFHHERIVHWKDLADQHDMILEMIGWMSPKLLEMTHDLDRFPRVYSSGDAAHLSAALRLLRSNEA